jgi:hypothetical protein
MQFGKRGRKKGIVGLTRINATPHSAKRQRQPQETHRRLKGSTGVWRQERWAIGVFGAELSTVQAAAVTPQQCFFESWVGAEVMIKVGGGLVGKQRDSATELNNPLPPFPPCPFPWERSFRGRALTTVTGQGRACLCRCWRGSRRESGRRSLSHKFQTEQRIDPHRAAPPSVTLGDG